MHVHEDVHVHENVEILQVLLAVYVHISQLHNYILQAMNIGLLHNII